LATENTGADHVNAGELAVLEDIARNRGSTITEITRRTGLAQSLVSRIVHAMSEAGAVSISPDGHDRRKVRIELDPRTREQINDRAGNTISDALGSYVSALAPAERRELEHHLSEAARLLQKNFAAQTTKARR
jgi:DNA-binding MarR family transcriptional regulator